MARRERGRLGLRAPLSGPRSLRSEVERLLRRLGGLNANALHSSMRVRRRAAGRGEAADLAAGGQNPVAGNDQGPDSWPSLRRRRAPPRAGRPFAKAPWLVPPQPTAAGLEVGKTLRQVEPDLREVRFSPLKYVSRRDDRRKLGSRPLRATRRRMPFGRPRAFVGN